MKQYSGWQAPFMSFYSASFYQEVGREWGGLGYLYLLLLIATVSLVYSLQLQIVYVPRMQEFMDTAIDRVPGIKIENGKLSIDKPAPYTVTLPVDKGQKSSEPATIIFDTREKPVDPKYTTAGILVTSDTVFVKERLQTREFDLSKIDHFALDKTQCKQLESFVFRWLAILLFLIYLPATFIVCLFQTIIYGSIGKLLASSANNKLGFGTLIRLSSVAMTPVIVLDLFFKTTCMNVPFWWLASIIITIGYLYYAIDANKMRSA